MKTKQKAWWFRAGDILPWSKVMAWILLPTVLISGSAGVGIGYYKAVKKRKAHDSRYHIVAIVQTGPEKEQLKTLYLAELLDLSIDKPTNIYTFDIAKGQERLLNSPLIKRAQIKKVPPGTLYVDYEVREPVAFITDLTNTVVDRDKVLFPFKPFFSPKKLPKMTLGEEEVSAQWGQGIDGKKIDLAFALMDLCHKTLSSHRTEIKAIDVSKALDESFGRRQAVVSIEERFFFNRNDTLQTLVCPVILRLSVDKTQSNLQHYLLMKQKILRKVLDQAAASKEQATVKFSPIVIDLRVPDIALLSNPGYGRQSK